MAKIAISYRRSDSQDITGRIFDRLVRQYGKDTVFRDIDSIQPGIDFRTQIADALTTTDVLLVVVGAKWLGRGEGASSRIDNEADPVRIEVETALKRSIPIIPILVGGTAMPEIGQLPDSIKDFAYRHAVTVDGGRDFDHHVDGLVGALDRFFAGKTGVAANREKSSGPTLPLQKYALIGGVVVALIVAVAMLRNGTKPIADTAQPVVGVASPGAGAAPVKAVSAAAPSDSQAERAWSVTKDSTSVAVLNDFIRQFGDTPYGSMARARAQELQKSQAIATAQPAAPSLPPQAFNGQINVTPSFDCVKAHDPDEKAICRNGELSLLDRELDVLFSAVRSRLNKDQQKALAAAESAWLSQRSACASDDDCIRAAYQDRISQLRSWQ
jgi:uncharacterized protein YecT (DUF1311 family)